MDKYNILETLNNLLDIYPDIQYIFLETHLTTTQFRELYPSNSTGGDPGYTTMINILNILLSNTDTEVIKWDYEEERFVLVV